MTITEPVTMVTDYLLAALCLWFAGSLISRSRAAGGRAVGLWVAAFVVTAVAALAGGTAHGFRMPLGDTWAVVWRLTVWSIGASAVLLVAAGVYSALRSEAENPEVRSQGIGWLKRGIAVSLVGLVVLVGRVSLHEHFNQNDLYHVIQMAGLCCLYRGAGLLHALT